MFLVALSQIVRGPHMAGSGYLLPVKCREPHQRELQGQCGETCNLLGASLTTGLNVGLWLSSATWSGPPLAQISSSNLWLRPHGALPFLHPLCPHVLASVFPCWLLIVALCCHSGEISPSGLSLERPALRLCMAWSSVLGVKCC